MARYAITARVTVVVEGQDVREGLALAEQALWGANWVEAVAWLRVMVLDGVGGVDDAGQVESYGNQSGVGDPWGGG